MRLRLCTFWFLYMAGFGVFFPFYSLYLRQELRLSGTEVGMVMAVLPLVGIFAQSFWGQLADRTGSRRGVLAALAVGVAVASLGLGFPRTFPAALAATALLALFLSSMLPQATAVSLAAEAPRGAGAFGFVRMWGTLGFLAAVVLFPPFLDRFEAAGWMPDSLPWGGLGVMFLVVAVMSALSAAVAVRLPKTESLGLRSVRGEGWRLLRHPPLRRLLLVVFAAHLCLQGPINLFPLFIQSHGGDVDTVGRMWIFMLLLEIPLIGLSGETLRRLGPRGLLTLGLVAEGIRWTTCAFTTDLAVIQVVMLLHGVGVAGVIIGAPLYLELAVPANLRSTGQALISTVGFGAAAILSISLGGWLFDRVGPDAPYAVSGIGVLTLGLLLHRVLPEPWRP